MSLQEIGVIGLGVMGRNLALNMEDKDFTVSVYDAWPEAAAKMRETAKGKKIACHTDLKEFVGSLSRPRKILLMVKAGDVVDQTIRNVTPFLSREDLLIDGGNSFYQDTERRSGELAAMGVRFLGMGVSGGEEGALRGPSLMPGGSRESYDLMRPVLTAIAAKAEGEPCCTYIGPGGSGHFVKMVHNGIEYADMQLICEAYSLLKNISGFSNEKIGKIFAEWNQRELNSYLIEITADILQKKDADTGRDLVDVISDRAGQKGTGKWASQTALDFGVSTPTITESVFARFISSVRAERLAASKVFEKVSPERSGNRDAGTESLEKALYTAKIFAYAQGFALMKQASDANGWRLEFDKIAAIFRGGCIIRAQFLNKITQAYQKNPGLQNMMLDPYFTEIIRNSQKDLRRVVSAAVEAAIPIPAFTSAVSYFDSYTCENLPTNLLQAQRDYFGAHTFERTDKTGCFHVDWSK